MVWKILMEIYVFEYKNVWMFVSFLSINLDVLPKEIQTEADETVVKYVLYRVE